MRNSDLSTKLSVETFLTTAYVILVICYRRVWKRLQSNSITCKFSTPEEEPAAHTFFKRSAILDGKRPFCVSEPFWGVKSNIRWSS